MNPAQVWAVIAVVLALLAISAFGHWAGDVFRLLACVSLLFMAYMAGRRRGASL